ncbi:hypothetical protein DSO57_1026865 [Entomophthora muscae]|uniref:Uncharacterized protein n=1 Tax=Entomophthora muscae TaxID=34485 RepID=A0ACC2T226_9FUNG|nr:hypothetical protein DSO57_1026865 [Entomophthora muscae]
MGHNFNSLVAIFYHVFGALIGPVTFFALQSQLPLPKLPANWPMSWVALTRPSLALRLHPEPGSKLPSAISPHLLPAGSWTLYLKTPHFLIIFCPLKVLFDISAQHQVPWLLYLLFLCLLQGSQLLGKFLTLFQAAATSVALPKSVKVAALKVALDSTGTDLPPWSEPLLLLSELVSLLHNYTVASSLDNCKFNLDSSSLNLTLNPKANNLVSTLKKGPSKNIDSQSTSAVNSPKPATCYELKSVNSYPQKSETGAPTLCILDNVPADPHASRMSPIDGGKTLVSHALPQNLFSPNSLSPLTTGGMMSPFTMALMIQYLLFFLAQLAPATWHFVLTVRTLNYPRSSVFQTSSAR